MKFLLFYLPTIGTRKQIEKGMSGQNRQNYQNILWQMSEQCKAADQMDYWGVAFTEHHFHIEGFEASNNPILLDLYIAMQTKNLRVGQMANVLPFQNPLRLAEDLAMLDHMTKGRCFAGFARGYQRRWADTLGQIYGGVQGIMSDKSAADIKNRKLFEEHFQILKKAWTQPTFSHTSEFWTIPPDNLNFNHDAVVKYGKGQDQNGMIREIGIAPQCYQQPHMPIFMPFSFSEETYRFCAHENIAPFTLLVAEKQLDNLFRTYQEESAKAGFNHAWGKNLGIFRDCFVAEDSKEAHHYASNANGFIWPQWFAPIGFNEGLRQDGEEGPISHDINYQGLVDRGFEFVGTPDEVNRMMEKLVKRHNPEYFLMWQYPGTIPHDKMMRNLELWATEVMPNWID